MADNDDDGKTDETSSKDVDGKATEPATKDVDGKADETSTKDVEAEETGGLKIASVTSGSIPINVDDDEDGVLILDNSKEKNDVRSLQIFNAKVTHLSVLKLLF
jgi:hypothetical protein